jgi:hypothetical protein
MRRRDCLCVVRHSGCQRHGEGRERVSSTRGRGPASMQARRPRLPRGRRRLAAPGYPRYRGGVDLPLITTARQPDARGLVSTLSQRACCCVATPLATPLRAVAKSHRQGMRDAAGRKAGTTLTIHLPLLDPPLTQPPRARQRTRATTITHSLLHRGSEAAVSLIGRRHLVLRRQRFNRLN